MSNLSEIDDILTALGDSSTVEETEYALRNFGDREVRTVLAQRAAAGGGSGTPAGDDGEVQFNDAGAFGASADLVFDPGTGELRLGSTENATATIRATGLAAEMVIAAGAGDASHSGGPVILQAGASDGDDGGNIQITAGTDTAGGDGGFVSIQSGSSSTGSGGAITIEAGNPGGTVRIDGDLIEIDTAELSLDATKVGFYGGATVVKPTGVAVTAEAIHAALVTLGLIAGP